MVDLPDNAGKAGKTRGRGRDEIYLDWEIFGEISVSCRIYRVLPTRGITRIG